MGFDCGWGSGRRHPPHTPPHPRHAHLALIKGAFGDDRLGRRLLGRLGRPHVSECGVAAHPHLHRVPCEAGGAVHDTRRAISVLLQVGRHTVVQLQ